MFLPYFNSLYFIQTFANVRLTNGDALERGQPASPPRQQRLATVGCGYSSAMPDFDL